MVDKSDFCIDSLIGFEVFPSDINRSTTYLRVLEVIYCLPKEEKTKDLFVKFMENKVEVIASLCPIILRGLEHHRWILEMGSEY